MKIVIDQRKIPELMGQLCQRADSDRDRPADDGGAAHFDGFETKTPRPSAAPFRAYNVMHRRPPPVDPQGNNAASDNVEATPSDVTVEICGLVQIFNLPDVEKLGTGSAADPGKRPAGVPRCGRQGAAQRWSTNAQLAQRCKRSLAATSGPPRKAGWRCHESKTQASTSNKSWSSSRRTSRRESSALLS